MNECKEAFAEPALLAIFSLLAVYYNYIPNVALFFFLFPLPPLSILCEERRIIWFICLVLILVE